MNRVLNWMLLLVPLAIGLRIVHANPLYVFITSALAIIPLAGWMGRSTEWMAEHLGAGIGGLLNATFGNAAELIIAIMALRAGLQEVVKASITGSIIGNVLLVLGLAIVVSGIKHKTLIFNRTTASLSTTLLALSAIALIVPALFHRLAAGSDQLELEHALSFEISIVLAVTYVLSLVFALRTHKHLYVGSADADCDAAFGMTHVPLWLSIVILAAATVLVGVLSELLVASIEQATHRLGMSDIFVGVFIVAIIGNAAEHSTAILVATKNKMDLAVNIAVGSSLQVALMVAPLLVFISYGLGRPLDLLFTAFEIAAVALAVGIVSLIALDGESNWMEGVLLLAVYSILGVAFYTLPR
jgi:Ca2+:H+ antiporter